MNLWWTYQQLRSSNLKTRLAVIAKLAETKQTDCVEPLLFALKDREMEIRGAAALALGQFQADQVVEPLIKMLRDPAPLVRSTATETLGQLQALQAIPPLIGLLRDADATVRLRAANNLERLGWHPENEEERTWQIVARGNLSQVADLGSEGIQPLVEMMRNGSPEKQLSAIKALSGMEDPRIVKLMLEALKKKDVVMRLVALETLQRLADPTTFGAVERMLKDSEPNVRAAAVAAVISCDAARALPLLVGILKDVSWEVRRETVKALGKIGDETAVDGLCKLLKDRDHDVRECAATALGKIGEPKAIQFLVMALLDVESFVRSAAQNSLSEINPHWEKTAAAHSVLPQIQIAVKSREYWISHSAARLLEMITSKTEGATAELAINPMIEMNTTPQTSSSLPAAAFAILSDLLGDRDRDLRLAAAEAFGQLREKGAASLLATALNDNDIVVREAAERALIALN